MSLLDGDESAVKFVPLGLFIVIREHVTNFMEFQLSGTEQELVFFVACCRKLFHTNIMSDWRATQPLWLHILMSVMA